MAKEKSVRRCKVCGKVLQPPRLWYCSEHAESAHKEARKRAEKRSYQRRKQVAAEEKKQDSNPQPGVIVLPPVAPSEPPRKKRAAYTNDLNGDVCRLEHLNAERREKGLPPLSYGTWRAMQEGRVKR